ncbi:MAG: helix-turn-helix domain-containing protein [Solirubrobacteraceae bacterium]
MPTRAQVLTLLQDGHSYQTAARELKIPPGQAYMIATGLPADGSDTPHPDELHDKPVLAGSSQHLVNPPAFNPTRDDAVAGWVKERALRELEPPASAGTR